MFLTCPVPGRRNFDKVLGQGYTANIVAAATVAVAAFATVAAVPAGLLDKAEAAEELSGRRR